MKFYTVSCDNITDNNELEIDVNTVVSSGNLIDEINDSYKPANAFDDNQNSIWGGRPHPFGAMFLGYEDEGGLQAHIKCIMIQHLAQNFPTQMTVQAKPTNGSWNDLYGITNVGPGVNLFDLEVFPSDQPSGAPSASPSDLPSVIPSNKPSGTPSTNPSNVPSMDPSDQPSETPFTSPSDVPSVFPSDEPSGTPSTSPSDVPSMIPSGQPSVTPSTSPSGGPSVVPSDQPTRTPSTSPSMLPSMFPSSQPSVKPSGNPSILPSMVPSDHPSETPSSGPSDEPSMLPSMNPSDQPSQWNDPIRRNILVKNNKTDWNSVLAETYSRFENSTNTDEEIIEILITEWWKNETATVTAEDLYAYVNFTNTEVTKGK